MCLCMLYSRWIENINEVSPFCNPRFHSLTIVKENKTSVGVDMDFGDIDFSVSTDLNYVWKWLKLMDCYFNSSNLTFSGAFEEKKPYWASIHKVKVDRGIDQFFLDHFSICACYLCAEAMLIFSVSYQFYRMSPKGRR